MNKEPIESDEPVIDDQRSTPESTSALAWLRDIAAPLRPPGSHMGLWYRQVNSLDWEYRIVCYAGYYQDINTAGDGYAVIDDVPDNPIVKRNAIEVTRLICSAVAASVADAARLADPVTQKIVVLMQETSDMDVKAWLAARLLTSKRGV